MKTILPGSHFANLTMEEVEAALDLCDELDDEADAVSDTAPSATSDVSPCSCSCSCSAPLNDTELSEQMAIVEEVERLLAAYAEKFEEYCQKSDGEIPEEALLFRPDSPIAQVAFGIFTEALHDSLMDEDDVE